MRYVYKTLAQEDDCIWKKKIVQLSMIQFYAYTNYLIALSDLDIQ